MIGEPIQPFHEQKNLHFDNELEFLTIMRQVAMGMV